MGTMTESPVELYHNFCTKNNIKPYSLDDLASKMNITLQRLEFTLATMVKCYPDKLKQIHEKH